MRFKLEEEKDLDYGISFFYPSHWTYVKSRDSPIRFAFDDSKSLIILASPLEYNLVEKGLRAICKWVIEKTFGVVVDDAEVNYNIEGNLSRKFEVRAVWKDSYFIVRGIIELVNIKTTFGEYNEYFMKCIISLNREIPTELEEILDMIKKSSSGIGFNAPFKKYSHTTNFFGFQDVLWEIEVPLNTVLIPNINSVSGTMGRLFFEIKCFSYEPRFLNDSFLEAQIQEYAGKFLYTDEFTVEIKTIEKNFMMARAVTKFGLVLLIYVNWFNMMTQAGDTAIVSVKAFSFPESAEYGAMKVILRIVGSWRIGSSLIQSMIHSPETTPIQMLTVPKKPVKRDVISTSKTETKDECEESKLVLLNKISNIKMLIRSLDHEYKTQIEALKAIKQSDITTGMYTFENPAGNIRFIRTKVLSPIFNDRFWEHKDMQRLNNKTFLATRGGRVPPMRHKFVELKWKVEEEIKRLEKEYKMKRKKLEDELKMLEEKLKKCK